MICSAYQIAVLEHKARHRKDNETPPFSPDGSLLSHDDSLLHEATEFEVRML